MAHVETTNTLLMNASRWSFTIEGKPTDVATRQSPTNLYKSFRISLSAGGFNAQSGHEQVPWFGRRMYKHGYG